MTTLLISLAAYIAGVASGVFIVLYCFASFLSEEPEPWPNRWASIDD